MSRCVHEDYEVQFDPVTDEPEHVICAQCHGLWPVGERIKSVELALELLKPEQDEIPSLLDALKPLHEPDDG